VNGNPTQARAPQEASAAAGLQVVGFPEYEAQARALAAALGARCGVVALHRFPDGESRVRLPLPLASHLVFCRSLDHPNDRLVELLIAAGAARALGAARLTLVAPYLCYMRQDAEFAPGEAVSQRIVGGWLAGAFDDVVTVDPHLHRVATLADAVPARRALALSAAEPIGALLARATSAPLVLGPDEESLQWVRAVARVCGADGAVGRKRRRGDRDVTVDLGAVEPRGREVALVDDVASTGHTLEQAVRACRDRGAARVVVAVTHGLFVGDALERLLAAGAEQVWSTDSVSHPTNAAPLATLLADGVRAVASPLR
jgi:ribose-phosphate pyrophosphokinase